MGLLTIAMLVMGGCRNLPIPYTVILVVLGLAFSFIARHYEPTRILLQFQLTPDVVLFLFLPALIFETAFNLEARQLLKDLIPILVLAIPALLISTCFIGFSLWLILDMQLILALLFGALISATDPVAVIALFKELGAPERLTILVEGESLLNDATAIVVFKILLLLAISTTGFVWQDAGGAFFDFLEVFIGGLLAGTVVGFVLSEFLYRLFRDLSAFVIMTIVVAYASFIVAEHVLHVSGVMAVVSSALTLGMLWVPRIPQTDTYTVRDIWRVIALMSNSLLFLLVGLSVDLGSLITRLDVILVAIILVLVVRASLIYTLVPATVKWFSLPRISFGEQHIMWWGGLKGGLAIAMVLSIPETMPGKDLLLDLTLGTVVFSLLVNGTTVRPLMRRLGIDKLTDDELAELKQGLVRAGEKSLSILGWLQKSGLISRVNQQRTQQTTQEVFTAEVPVIAKQQRLKHLYLSALHKESDELKYLYEINLIQHYTYLKIRNNIQHNRETILVNRGDICLADPEGRNSVFLKTESILLKRLRERDWATWLLSRYQNARLSQRMQADIADVLICASVLEMLDTDTTFESAQREQVAEKYRQRLANGKSRLNDMTVDFPEFCAGFEINWFTQAALIAASHDAEKQYHEGEISTKVLTRIGHKIHQTITTLPPIEDSAVKLTASELIGTVPLLHGLSTEVLKSLAQCAKPLTFLAGDIIIGEGERGDALYIVIHGMLVVYKQKAIIAELKNGDFFGEMALLGDHVRTATVKAKHASTLLRLSSKEIIKLALSDAELNHRLMQLKRERQARIDLVSKVTLLSDLPSGLLDLVAGKATEVKFKPDDPIIIEGEIDDSLYIIMQGCVSILKMGELIAELGIGDFFGETALLGDQVRTATVKTQDQCILLKLRGADITQIARDYPLLQRRLEAARKARIITV